MKKLQIFCRAVCLAAVLAAASAQAGELAGEVLTNADVIAMVEAGLTPELVRAKIQATPGVYDLSSRAMILLKQNNVPDDVLAAMMTAAEQPGSRPALDAERYRSELENIAYGSTPHRTAAIAWMQANSAATFPALRQSLADPRAEIRSAAVTVLSRAGDRESLPAIRNLLADSSTIVRGVAAQALVEMNDTSAISAAEQAVLRQVNPVDGYARLVGHARLTQSAAALGEVLARNSDAVNRVAAAWALGEIGRPGVAGRAALENALFTDPDPDVRREAAQAIAKFHDANGAQLLEVACRQDPEVRKVSLAAMAEYPETMAFLISVMSLGADQIAADELETARASLTRLTGQDFGLDGNQWADWYAVNYQRFANAMPPSSLGGAAGGPPAPASGSRNMEVDVMSWGIVADSSAIPMDPMIEASAGIGGGSGGTGAGAAPSAPAAPGMPSLTGFGASGLSGSSYSTSLALDGSAAVASPSGNGYQDVPSAIPDFDSGSADASGFGAAPGGAPVLRTWSSDPGRSARAPSAPDAAPAPATASAPLASPLANPLAGDSDWREARVETPSFDFPTGLGGATADASPASPAFAPAPSPTPAPATASASTSPLRPPPEAPSGISLPIPGAGGAAWADDSASVPAMPMDGGGDPYAALSTPASPGMPTAPSSSDDDWAPPGFMGIDGSGAPDAAAFATSPIPDGFESGDDYPAMFQSPPGSGDPADSWTGDLFAAPQMGQPFDESSGASSVPDMVSGPDGSFTAGSSAPSGSTLDEMSSFMPVLPGMDDDEYAEFQEGGVVADTPAPTSAPAPASAFAPPPAAAPATAGGFIPALPGMEADDSASPAPSPGLNAGEIMVYQPEGMPFGQENQEYQDPQEQREYAESPESPDYEEYQEYLRDQPEGEENATIVAAPPIDSEAGADQPAADWEKYFVEPEPGQLVIGDPIMPGDVVSEHPETPMPPPQSAPPVVSSSPPTTPPPASTAAATPPPSMSPPPQPPPPSSSSTAVVVDATQQPQRRGFFSRRSGGDSGGGGRGAQPRVDTVTGASAPRPAFVPSTPPQARVAAPAASPDGSSGQTDSAPPADGSHTSFGSAGSLPPVKPEGLVGPSSNQGQAKMLGEGLF